MLKFAQLGIKLNICDNRQSRSITALLPLACTYVRLVVTACAFDQPYMFVYAVNVVISAQCLIFVAENSDRFRKPGTARRCDADFIGLLGK